MQERPMVTDPRFDTYADEAEGPPKKRSWLATCLVGCAIMLGIAVVIGVIAGFWISRNWRDWFASFGSAGIEQGIDDAQLPAEEKAEIKVQVNRVTEAFRDGQLSIEQLQVIVTKLVDSPLMTSLVATAADNQYIAKSGLSEEEKTEGRRNLRRFVRGVIDDQIDDQQIDAVLAHIADREPNGNWRLRNQVSDEDLRKFLEAAKAQADDAGVAEEPAEIDPSDEVKKIVDDVLNVPGNGVPEREMPQNDEPAVEAPQDAMPEGEVPEGERNARLEATGRLIVQGGRRIGG